MRDPILATIGLFVIAVPSIMLLTHVVAWLWGKFTAPMGPPQAKRCPYGSYEEFRRDVLSTGVPVEDIVLRAEGRLPARVPPWQASRERARERLAEVQAKIELAGRDPAAKIDDLIKRIWADRKGP